MKKLLFIALFSLLSTQIQAKFQILACEPEWGALANEIGGDKVNVYNATTAAQDPHHIEARPSLIAKARRADMLICTGADLEIGWLPLLLKKSANPAIQKNSLGHFMATDYVHLLGKLEKVDRSMGDVHAAGNPHIQTDPRRVLQVTEALVNKMKLIDSANAEHYQQRYLVFKQRWQQAIQTWHTKAKALQHMPIIVHHDSWVYLNDWLGLKQVTALEPKPGIPPSGSHLSELLQQLKQTPAEIIIYSSYQNPRSANWLAEKANIPAIKIPPTVGGTTESKDLFRWFDDIIARLLRVKE